ncbi:MAG: DUF1292 domain-containing protein [Bacilli bacterium]|nr:DUF1292 domain-containing protein [Bacilli bacterium]
MVDIDTIVLENGVEYTEIDDLIHNDTRYILLSNIKNVKDSCIRKIEIEDGEEYLSKLEDDNEYERVLDLFLQKNKALFN